MKFFLTICIYNILLYAIPAHSQNLVSNCNLEKWSECPTDHSQIYYCENWYSPGEGTSDYCNGCSSNDFCSVPNNLWGDQLAANGVGYAHIICYYPQGHQWEYIQTKLACNLIAGETYDISFMVSCSDRSHYAIDGMGLQFSSDSLLQTGTNIISIPGGPHISNTPGTALSDKTDWIEISGQYIASGDEQYITIGNFIVNSNLYIHTFPAFGDQLPLASYYIDKITVVPATSMLNLGNDTTLCPQATIVLDAFIPCATSYLWNNGSSDSAITISTSGNYSVEVEIGCGSISDEINVQYLQYPDISLPNDTSICVGADIILDAGSGFNSYLWQDGSINQEYIADSAGLYWVEVEDITGCIIRDYVDIGMITIPSFHIGNDTTLCIGNSITLYAGITGPYMEYLWNDFSIDTSIVASDPGIYWLEVSNPCGIVTDSICIDFRNCSTNIYLPNAFTPNGDGNNDSFIPIAANITNFKMYIFDRWGKQVFETTLQTMGWDGTCDGDQCPMGTYIWVVQYQEQTSISEQKTETLKGAVTLLR